jgi:Na+/H+ antiporter NhaA|tara:strand:+ start:1090 stop:1230 length:141 start_codon:yes stop_codon:yes gene_type:complete
MTRNLSNKEQMEYIYIGIAIGFMLGFAVGLWIESYLAVKNLMVEMS